MKTIELTQEQWEALQRGESITIEPPKPKVWAPKALPLINGIRLCTSKEAAAVMQLRAAETLLLHRLEHFPDWVDDGGEAWFIYSWENGSTTAESGRGRTLSTVYGPREWAEMAAEWINEGRLVL